MGAAIVGGYADGYKDAFDKVADKTKWKRGLIVDTGDAQFRVVDIRGLGRDPPGTLRVGEAAAGTVYVYTYQGSEIVDKNPHGIHEIYMMEIIPQKLGGGRKVISKPKASKGGINGIIINDEKPDFIRGRVQCGCNGGNDKNDNKNDNKNNLETTSKCAVAPILGSCEDCRHRKKRRNKNLSVDGEPPKDVIDKDVINKV